VHIYIRTDPAFVEYTGFRLWKLTGFDTSNLSTSQKGYIPSSQHARHTPRTLAVQSIEVEEEVLAAMLDYTDSVATGDDGVVLLPTVTYRDHLESRRR
jgi:hypothetical protein